MDLKSSQGFKQEALSDEDIAGPLLLIDTAGCGMTEEIDDDFDDSKRNQGEAAVALKHCQRLLKLGVDMRDIGIITPYAAQVAFAVITLLAQHQKASVAVLLKAAS